MEIRNEIEKLRFPIMPELEYKAWGGENAARNYNIHRTIANGMLDAVLAILDKWGCVVEDEAGKLISRRIGDLLKKNVKPGDHITILRKNE